MDLLLEVHLVAQPHRERQTLRDEGHAQNQALNNGKEDGSGGQFNTVVKLGIFGIRRNIS